MKYIVTVGGDTEAQVFDTFALAKAEVIRLVEDGDADPEDIKLYQISKEYGVTPSVAITGEEV